MACHDATGRGLSIDRWQHNHDDDHDAIMNRDDGGCGGDDDDDDDVTNGEVPGWRPVRDW